MSLVDAVRGLNNPNFGVLFDTSHAHVCGTGRELDLYGRSRAVNHVHLADSTRGRRARSEPALAARGRGASTSAGCCRSCNRAPVPMTGGSSTCTTAPTPGTRWQRPSNTWPSTRHSPRLDGRRLAGGSTVNTHDSVTCGCFHLVAWRDGFPRQAGGYMGRRSRSPTDSASEGSQGSGRRRGEAFGHRRELLPQRRRADADRQSDQTRGHGGSLRSGRRRKGRCRTW